MAIRRTNVKLDTSGLKYFAGTFGKQGQTFMVGLFDKVNASKGAALEFGDESNNQPARPWLSQFGIKGSQTQKGIELALAQYVKATLKGVDRKKQTANRLTELAKGFLRLQEFPAAKETPLSPWTVKRKIKKGRSNPDLVGIDSRAMINALTTRTKGGSRRKLK